MSNWLLIITFTSGLWGSGTPVSSITMHDFPSRELCESAAKQAEWIANGYGTTFDHKCLRQEAGKWVEGK